MSYGFAALEAKCPECGHEWEALVDADAQFVHCPNCDFGVLVEIENDDEEERQHGKR